MKLTPRERTMLAIIKLLIDALDKAGVDTVEFKYMLNTTFTKKDLDIANEVANECDTSKH